MPFRYNGRTYDSAAHLRTSRPMKPVPTLSDETLAALSACESLDDLRDELAIRGLVSDAEALSASLPKWGNLPWSKLPLEAKAGEVVVISWDTRTKPYALLLRVEAGLEIVELEDL